MGNGASISLPARIPQDKVEELAKEKFDVAKFEALKGEDGMISKEDYMKLIANTKEQAEAESKADTEAATAGGVEWLKCHSCIRWNKPIPEIEAIITSPLHCNSVDTKNGNYPIHIAAQNGHAELVRWLVSSAGGKFDVQNGTGQTPMHMAIAYDYHDVVAFLREVGANEEITNWHGFPAKFGIDGDKDPNDPFFMLEGAKTTPEALAALAKLAEAVKAEPTKFEKSKVAMLGMGVKKGSKALPKESWTPDCQGAFTGIMATLP